MPNMPAAEKALRQTRKHTAINAKATAELGKLKSAIKKAIEGKDAKKAKELFVTFQARADKGIKTGLLKKSSGGRMKSRLMAIVNKAAK
ncbi:MAG: 30S ribosomal protein S20 [bacterium]